VQLPLRKNKQGKTMYPDVRESFMLDVSANDSVEDLSALLRAPVEEETAAERYQAQCKRNNIAPLNSVCKLLATCAPYHLHQTCIAGQPVGEWLFVLSHEGVSSGI
jgi:hypothetical protein